MDSSLSRVFKSEIERQSKFALIAAADLNSSLKNNNQDRIWYSVQALLVAVGNLSKLFWPKKDAMRVQLLDEFHLSDDSAIAPRNFRNHFEHFDERIETWAASSESRVIVDSNVGPPTMISISGIDSSEFLRNFDTKSYAVTFRGDLYPLRPVLEEVVRIHDHASKPRVVA